jgi:NTP pyrophosphatase (non-canonical NTP hydrolase)
MAGECGEACNLIKKLRRGQDITVESIGKELADVVTYVDLLAARLGIDLEVAIINKFNEVSDRCGSAIKLGEQ